MKLISRRFRNSCIMVGLAIALFLTGCEPYKIITYDNQTKSSIKVTVRAVELEYFNEPISFTYDAHVPPIEAGKSQGFVSNISEEKLLGARYKYMVVAINETNKVVFSKVYTWDELNKMNWVVVITANDVEQSDNSTAK